MLKQLITWINRKLRFKPKHMIPMYDNTPASRRMEEIHFHWHFESNNPRHSILFSQIPGGLTMNRGFWNEELTLTEVNSNTPQKTLENALSHWQFGDWESLIALDHEIIEIDAQRAKLALLVAAAHYQLGDIQNGKHYIQLAKQWGCDKKLLGRILISGVHNNLAKAACLLQDHNRMTKHFQIAVKGGYGDERLYSNVRQHQEMARLESKN